MNEGQWGVSCTILYSGVSLGRVFHLECSILIAFWRTREGRGLLPVYIYEGTFFPLWEQCVLLRQSIYFDSAFLLFRLARTQNIRMQHNAIEARRETRRMRDKKTKSQAS